MPCHTNLEKQFADFLDRASDVVWYFKNERFGFSVTYYEGNRPRQYYPDFIVVAREADGREVMWLAETKGEIRLNTALKSEAATLWCEKMSRTAYGQWRYLFIAQRKLEGAIAAGVKSLTDMSGSLVMPRLGPQLRLVSLDDARAKREVFQDVNHVIHVEGRGRLLRRRGGCRARGLAGGDGDRKAGSADVRRTSGRSINGTDDS